jgi:hypothetical protein
MGKVKGRKGRWKSGSTDWTLWPIGLVAVAPGLRTNESDGSKLFGISGAQVTRITPSAQFPFFENKILYFKSAL